jgi:murein L,D-transpeptidase YafK
MNFKNLLICFVFVFTILNCRSEEEDFINYHIPLTQLLERFEVDQNKLWVLVDKSEYTLSILSDSVIIKEYPVVFGGNPVDDKRMQGDQCTPEGIFHIRSKYPHKSWEKFIWLNYPTNDSWKKHNEAKQKREIPADAEIGGEIGIHGVPNNMNTLIDLKQNWTLGCISLKNNDINEIYPFIHEQTKIEIRK